MSKKTPEEQEIEVLEESTTEQTGQNLDSASKALIPAKITLPQNIGIIVIQGKPLFPNMVVPLGVEGEIFTKTTSEALNMRPPYLAIVVGKDESDVEKLTMEHIFHTGVLVRLVKSFQISDNSAQVLLDVMTRIKVKNIFEKDGTLQANVEIIEEESVETTDVIRAYSREIISNLKELIKLNPLIKEELHQFINQINIDDPHRLADFAATLTSASKNELQNILETIDIQQRLERTLLLVKKELDLARLQAKISNQIEEKISKNQREFFLRHQLKEIRKELGLSKDEKSQEVEKFVKLAKKLKWPEEVDKVFHEELNKLSLLETQSPEFNVSRNYLEWITALPWGLVQNKSISLEKARRVLEEDHYGLEDIKERILDMLATIILRNGARGKVICLVGPPGVGKTSIGKSIARALNLPFYRFSLGGMRDEAEIKGHRRTYIGAMPGKFIQALKIVGKENALIMLDEVDKLSQSYAGDPASALLEVLDKEQNSKFRDHYLDLPFDLSKVLFICTANQTESIPPALLDRMDVIRLSAYTVSEKIEIAKRYLIAKQKSENGLKNRKIEFTPKALLKVVEDYAREAGVRNLEKMIERILRILARKILENKIKSPIKIDEKMVVEFLKSPIYTKDEIIGEGVPGCVNALAWTNYGGSILSIESNIRPAENSGFKQTGQLGAVMVESSEIAYSYVLANFDKFKIDLDKFKKRLIHLHVPAGATPKDGPSAGIAMALSLVSLMKNEPIKAKIGLTGEISLTGEVLPIGGLKEKIIAAQRAGLKTIILPYLNKSDYEYIPEQNKSDMQFHFVKHFEQVYQLAFKRVN